MRARAAVVAVIGALVLAACGTAARPSPRGERALPDLVPLPPTEMVTSMADRGLPRRVQFSSTLVNAGSGDFLLTASRDAGLLAGADDGAWSVIQAIPYTLAGREEVPVDAELAYGGDGHDHWHVRAVARYWLEPLDGEHPGGDLPPESKIGDPKIGDSKIGFCFFDFSVQIPELAGETDEAVYTSDDCGDEGDRRVEMGLSKGWGDTYQYYLQGQYIDLTGLPDGRYRLWGEADPQGWFLEERVDNNTTWSEILLRTRESDGAPVVELIGTADD